MKFFVFFFLLLVVVVMVFNVWWFVFGVFVIGCAGCWLLGWLSLVVIVIRIR